MKELFNNIVLQGTQLHVTRYFLTDHLTLHYIFKFFHFLLSK